MATAEYAPTREDMRRILGAAAEVIFSDGVSDAFLDQWANQTDDILSILRSRQGSQSLTDTPAPT